MVGSNMAKNIYECPHCGFNLEDDINYRYRWNYTLECPHCLNIVKVNFDFYVGEDGDEYDLYEVTEVDSI